MMRGIVNSIHRTYSLRCAIALIIVITVFTCPVQGFTADSRVSTEPDAVIAIKSQNPTVGAEIRFDGSASTACPVNSEKEECNDEVESYEWDLNRNGTTDARGPTVSKTFEIGGYHTIRLTIITANGDADTVYTKFFVNTPPAAEFTVSPPEPTKGSTVILNASSSTSSDAQDSISGYEWDLDGDGNAEKRGQQITHKFTQAGEITVSVSVTDSYGESDTSSRNIYIRADSDDDGLFNQREDSVGTDPNNPDTDDDGLLDGSEVVEHEISPLDSDTDGDGIADGREVKSLDTNPVQTDTDEDGLGDMAELELETDPTNPDTDNDGLADGTEVTETDTDPLVLDTDGDGVNDGAEVNNYASNPTAVNTDGDGLDDGRELTIETDPTKVDTDDDGLEDDRELALETDPTNLDTDNDGLADGRDVNGNTDPLRADTDSDGVNDGPEIVQGLSPMTPDTDGDLFPDGIDPLPSLVWFPLGGIQALLSGLFAVLLIRKPWD